MVLTRAQRMAAAAPAATPAVPAVPAVPAAPTTMLKAPAKRGRKKAEEATKPAPAKRVTRERAPAKAPKPALVVVAKRASKPAPVVVAKEALKRVPRGRVAVEKAAKPAKEAPKRAVRAKPAARAPARRSTRGRAALEPVVTKTNAMAEAPAPITPPKATPPKTVAPISPLKATPLKALAPLSPLKAPPLRPSASLFNANPWASLMRMPSEPSIQASPVKPLAAPTTPQKSPEAVEQPATEIPSVATEILSVATEILSVATEIPSVATEMPSPTTEIPSEPDMMDIDTPEPQIVLFRSTADGNWSPYKSALRSPLKNNDSPKKSVTWNKVVQQKSPAPPSADKGPLDGVVIYFDVHHHGQDAASAFTPLVEPLGASDVPVWADSYGITHVVFMNGDQATLEKVVASRGAVKCVNVGWIMDCDKEQMRLDETPYLIDLSHIPGSQTYRELSVFSAANTPLAPRTQTLFHTPAKQTDSEADPWVPLGYGLMDTAPMRRKRLFDETDDDDKENTAPRTVTDSPATPDFLHPEKLVQMTCPPKPTTGAEWEVLPIGHGTPFRRRLERAKRTSLEGYKSFGSPLKKMKFF